jgi:two-component system, OmpR family, response regulator
VPTPAILVTEDDEFLVQVLSEWFESRGFMVDVGRDGLEAVHKCRESLFEVVTMDIGIAKKRGIVPSRLIKEINPSMPVVMLTG